MKATETCNGAMTGKFCQIMPRWEVRLTNKSQPAALACDRHLATNVAHVLVHSAGAVNAVVTVHVPGLGTTDKRAARLARQRHRLSTLDVRF
jgi:hypothetical protein